MTTQEANIDIIRDSRGILKSVSLALPVWTKEAEDGFLSVNIPVLGIKTFAENDSDVDSAIKESITLFCLNAEEFGNGLENELRLVGWNATNRSFEKSSLSWFTNDDILGLIFETGDSYSETLELSA